MLCVQLVKPCKGTKQFDSVGELFLGFLSFAATSFIYIYIYIFFSLSFRHFPLHFYLALSNWINLLAAFTEKVFSNSQNGKMRRGFWYIIEYLYCAVNAVENLFSRNGNAVRHCDMLNDFGFCSWLLLLSISLFRFYIGFISVPSPCSAICFSFSLLCFLVVVVVVVVRNDVFKLSFQQVDKNQLEQYE